MTTNPFEVGATYTLGMTGPPLEATRPVRITSIEIVSQSGVEVIGVGAFDPDEAGTGIGLVPGWPPPGFDSLVHGADTYSREWNGPVYSVVGIRTTEARSGLRGVAVRWLDGDGASRGRVFDIAVITCAPTACDPEREGDVLLRDLGLVRDAGPPQ
jgi:hypothetical protein